MASSNTVTRQIVYLFGNEDCPLCDRKVDFLYDQGYTVFKMDAAILMSADDSILSDGIRAGARAILEMNDGHLPVAVDIYGEPVE